MQKHLRPCCPFWKGRGAMPPPWPRSPASLGQNKYGLVWAVVIHPPDEARNDAHIASTGVQLYYCTPRVITSKKRNGNLVMHPKSQLNQGSWNRTVFKFGSENQLNVHNYLSILFFVIFTWFARLENLTSLSVWSGMRRTPRVWSWKTWELLAFEYVKVSVDKKTSFEKLNPCKHVLVALQWEKSSSYRISFFVISHFGSPPCLGCRGHRPVRPTLHATENNPGHFRKQARKH